MADDFLSRWSRRKRRAEETERRPTPESQDRWVLPAEVDPNALVQRGDAPEGAEPGGAGVAPETSTALTPEEIAALPPLDALNATSDLGPFLQAGVPSALRNAALRRMWSLDPNIRDFVSEAREYSYDWNSPGGVPGLGPLLASDDVKAMVRRIFEGPAHELVREEAASAERADPAAPALDPGPDDRSCAALAPIEAAGPLAGMADAAASSSEAVAAETVATPGKGVSAPIPGPPMRRHGGAMPS